MLLISLSTTYPPSVVFPGDGDVVVLAVGVVVPVVVDDLNAEPVVELEHESAVVLDRQLKEFVVRVNRALHVRLDFEQQTCGTTGSFFLSLSSSPSLSLSLPLSSPPPPLPSSLPSSLP